MIRRARSTDLPWLRQLYTDFVTEVGAEYPRVDREDYDAFVLAMSRAIIQDPLFLAVVATDDADQPVGFMGTGILQRPIGAPHNIFAPHWLYIAPSHRGNGLGKALVSATLAWARKTYPQVTDVEVVARHGDPQWTRRGWQPYAITYHGTLADADAFIAGRPPVESTPAAVMPQRINGTSSKRRSRKRQMDLPLN